jgi:hypothetical protein
VLLWEATATLPLLTSPLWCYSGRLRLLFPYYEVDLSVPHTLPPATLLFPYYDRLGPPPPPRPAYSPLSPAPAAYAGGVLRLRGGGYGEGGREGGARSRTGVYLPNSTP